jgi:hypothetical protein
MTTPNIFCVNYDVSKWVVLYLSSSHRDIIANREYIFGDGFSTYIKAIYANVVLRKMYANFFIEFWEMPEVQRVSELILKVFCGYKHFQKAMIYKSIYHDDVHLFDKCVTLERDYWSPIKLKVHTYLAWNILEYLNGGTSTDEITAVLMRVRKGEVSLEDALTKSTPKITKIWEISSIFRYYDYFINLQYVHSDLEKKLSTVGSTKYEFHTYTRNLLKYILLHQNKMSEPDVHNFLMLHNNFSLIYEYFTFEHTGAIAGKGKNEPYSFQNHIINVLINKMQKGRNILKTLFNYKYLIVRLYETAPCILFEYLVKNYSKLRSDDVKFLLETIFYKTHSAEFYRVVSSSSEGKISKKERKCIYQSVKTKSRRFNPISIM